MNWIEKIEIEKVEVGHPRNGQDHPLLRVGLTPHEGAEVEVVVACRCLTARELADSFRGIAGAIERWGEERGITTDNLAAMVATGVLPPEAMSARPQ
jgi:hypothetical protein